MQLNKYDCKKTFESFNKNIEKLQNQNLKMDYSKIYSNLHKELLELEKHLNKPTDKTFDLYLLDYEIKTYIDKINKLI